MYTGMLWRAKALEQCAYIGKGVAHLKGILRNSQEANDLNDIFQSGEESERIKQRNPEQERELALWNNASRNAKESPTKTTLAKYV